jgi:(p)ppGpp synthase/HD superfamily hydrolase
MSYSERFDAALAYAARIHRDQVRKGSGVPYVTHLLAVAALVGEAGGSEDQVIAALLHDAIEDCVAEIPDIREQLAARFGSAVLDMVEACTDTDEVPKPPWRPRKEAYLARLRAEPPGAPALLVSLADKLHNATTIRRDLQVVGDAFWERFRGGREGTIWYYTAVAEAFAALTPGPLADELVAVTEEIGCLAARPPSAPRQG